MRCSALPPCMSAFPMRRSRCPIRCCRRISANSKRSWRCCRPAWFLPPTAPRSRAPSPPPCRRAPNWWSAPIRRTTGARRTFAALAKTAADARGRCRACRGRPRHDREISVHLRLDRSAEGRHQHAADAVRQPGDDRRGLCLPARRAAGHRRLAAVESHFRRQPQFRPGARQWRLALYRRGQAAAGRHRRDGAQSARRRADHLFQRAQRF